LGWQADLTWEGEAEQGRYTALLAPKGQSLPGQGADPVARELANDPEHARLVRGLTRVMREHLRKRLPDYMIPSAFVWLPELPLTSNGKMNRTALPLPERSALGVSDTPPRTETERRICSIWSKVLGIERVGVEDNFFDAGGHSLLATQAISRLNRDFGIQAP